MAMSRTAFCITDLVSSSTVEGPALIAKHSTNVTEKEDTEIKAV
jgi:hypothetical protein